MALISAARYNCHKVVSIYTHFYNLPIYKSSASIYDMSVSFIFPSLATSRRPEMSVI